MAALGVIISHVSGATGVTGRGSSWSLIIGNVGSSAVPIFFVLSGFLLYRPFVGAHLDNAAAPPAGTYLRHRLLRIFPGFWLAAVAYVFLVGPRFEATVGNYLAALSLTVPYRQGGYFENAILGVDWTLTVELAFYLALPLLAWAIGSLTRRVAGESRRLAVELGALGALYLVALVYRFAVVPLVRSTGVPGNLWLFNYLDWFALGMGLAVLWSWQDRGGRLPTALTTLASNWGACWLLAGWGYVVLSVVRFRATDGVPFASEPTTLYMVRFALNGLIGFLLVLPAVLGSATDGRLRRALCHPVVVWLGTISFGIYLWHVTWMRWFLERVPEAGFWVVMVVVLAMTIPTAAASWYLLERPLMRWRRAPLSPAATSVPAEARR